VSGCIAAIKEILLLSAALHAGRCCELRKFRNENRPNPCARSIVELLLLVKVDLQACYMSRTCFCVCCACTSCA
jgi:hypothetical protein